jgi:hypothetical protein
LVKPVKVPRKNRNGQTDRKLDFQADRDEKGFGECEVRERAKAK